MKKLGALLAALIIMLACAMPIFAAGVEITGISPSDGASGMQPTNVAVKIKFDGDMRSDEATDAANKAKIKISGPHTNENKEVVDHDFEFKVVHSDKHPNEIWLVLEDTLESNSEYTISIEPGIIGANGEATTQASTTTFKTRNLKTDSTISMIMMFVMMGLMIVMTQIETKKQMTQNDANYALAAAQKLNPYKIAKQKGISVEDAQAYCEKERAKAQKAVDKANAEWAKAEAAKQAELDAATARIEAELAASHAASVYKVKGPKSVKEAGGTIPKSVKNRGKAKEEAAKAAEKKRAQNSKGKKSKK